MNPITYVDAGDVTGALYHSEQPGRAFIAGGTNLIDLMKEQVMRPRALVDINGLALADITPGPSGGLLLGATARNADTAYHPLVRDGYPLLTAAILPGARLLHAVARS